MQNADMNQYLGVFLDEANEQLALLESEVLKMEKGDHSKEILQVLFRAAHTLKGSSRAMGFSEIGNLTHEMENVLDDLRNDQLSVSPPIIDALLECLDALTALLGAVSATGHDASAQVQGLSDLVKRLDTLRSGGLALSPNLTLQTAESERLTLDQDGEDAVADGLAAGRQVLRIDGIVDPTCPMKGVRVFMAFSNLERHGEILASVPEEPALDDQSDDGRFMVLLATEISKDEILAALQDVADLQGLKVEPMLGDGAQTDQQLINAANGVEEPEAPILQLESTPEPAQIKITEAVVDTQVPKKPTESAAGAGSQTIRVGIARLDALLNLVGELVTDRTQLTRLAAELHKKHANDEMVSDLNEALSRVSRITSELQDEVMKTRMLPIDGVFQRMPRMVRDIAQKVGKEVELSVTGGESELDRSVLEYLADPLIHILRNSVDHAIESPDERKSAGKPAKGLVKMSARYQESHILIEISDDGRGIDPEKIKAAAVKKGIISQAAGANLSDKEALNLIMASGFSTAATLSDISGRGVGMDIVKSNLDKIGGKLSLDSKVGIGTKVTIKLPLTLAISRALLVRARSQIYIIPLSAVVEMLYLGGSQDEITQTTVGSHAVIILRGQTVPLVGLADMLDNHPKATCPKRIGKDAHVVIVRHGDKNVGICIDSVAGDQEVVIKSLGPLLGEIPGISGASILGDGRVSLIVDISRAIEEVRHVDLEKVDVGFDDGLELAAV